MKCGLCGRIFDEQKAGKGCGHCPFHKDNCRLVCCPYCRFEMPPKPRWLNFNTVCDFLDIVRKGIKSYRALKLRNLFRPRPKKFPAKTKAAPALASSLDDLPVGNSARVMFLNSRDPKRVQHLTAMGVLPGTLLTLIQKFPCYVFELGQSQFAIDQELAQIIFVGAA